MFAHINIKFLILGGTYIVVAHLNIARIKTTVKVKNLIFAGLLGLLFS